MIISYLCDTIITIIEFLQQFVSGIPFFGSIFVDATSYYQQLLVYASYVHDEVLPIFYYFVPKIYFAPFFITFWCYLGVRIVFAVANLIWP